MPRPHVAALVHDAWNQRVARRLTDRGWGTRIVPHIGYGSTMTLRVLGRVVMDRDGRNGTDDARRSPRAGDAIRDLDSATRWWRDFVSSPAMQVPVAVTIGERTVDTTTDASGLIDLTVRGHGLPPGRHQVLLSTPHADDAHADVIVVSTTQRFGVVSDIDDTVLSTSLPRPVIAAWNTFVREEGTRRAVPGMATLYRELRAAHPDMPFVYLSTGSWNIAPNLGRFLRRHGYPSGPLLLTDWGPTNTGWFRSGQQHKRASLHRLAREFPHIQWLLVGDDGQHDPKVYAEFAAARPGSVRAIAIRQLTTGEQVLSHGLPVANDDLVPAPTEDLPMPVVRAADGYGLARLLRPILGLGRPELTLDPPDATSDEAGAPLRDEDYLILSTIHSAKGREWPAVSILNTVDGCLPSDLATGSEREIEEEMRLLYVAMTRARDHLDLLIPQRFYVSGQSGSGDRHVYASRSRFIPNRLLNHFEQITWPTAEPQTVARDETRQAAVDLAAKMRAMWD